MAGANTGTLAIRGADVGWSTQLASMGYTWEDQTQTRLSDLQILKNHGGNLIRIRTFVNPSIASGVLGVGNLDQAGSIALARAAAAMGFQIMIDFHLSDTWADPGHQAPPAAWASDNYTELLSDVSSYITGFMQALAADNIYPQYVQVGNEIDPGLLLPIGSTGNPAQLAGLINAGYSAVKAVSPSSKVVIHISVLDNLATMEWFFDLLQSNGAHWDASGFSDYDGYSELATIAANLQTMASRYSKPVMLCEIGYMESDGMGSAEMVKTGLQAVASVPNSQGLGIVYWEPEAPNDASTSYYTMGAVSEPTTKLLQFNPAIDQFLFTGTTSGNQIINPQFASGSNGWQITTTTPAAISAPAVGNGTMLSVSSNSAFNVILWQDVTGVPNGAYTLTAMVESSGGLSTAQVYATPAGGSTETVSLPAAGTWTQLQLSGIQVTGNMAQVGFTLNGSAGSWVRIESVSFTAN